MAIRRVLPNLPVQLRGVISNATTVDVVVSINEAGNVVKAEFRPGSHPLLREAAVRAARQWKFQPAEHDGRPVPSETVLRFNFDPHR